MRRVVCIMISIGLLLCGCSRNDVDSYPPDVEWNVVIEGHNSGMIRVSPEYCISKDGKDYIAFGLFSARCYTLTEDEIVSLHPGDEIKIDSFTRTVIDRLDIDREWVSDQGSNYIDCFGFAITRNPGKVVINDEFYLLHPPYSLYEDGHIEIDGQKASYEETDTWRLYYAEGDVCDELETLGPVVIYEDPVWVPVASDCKIDIFGKEPGIPIKTVEHDDLRQLLEDYNRNEGIEKCYVDATMDDDGEIFELQISIYETY